jgi:glycosyltransferase involved in cell wall biosynthesis
LGDRVHFLGLLSGNDYWDALAGADLLVLNSYSENFAMAPAEALAIGIPVLLSDQVGIADLVFRYRAGVIVPLEVRATAEAMVAMLAEKNMLCEMGKNGVRLVHDQFSPDRVGKLFAAFLEDVVYEYRKSGRT